MKPLDAFPGAPAKKVSLADLKVSKARLLAQALAKGRPFAKLQGLLSQPDTGCEAVIFEVEVELGQKQAVPIQRFETIAAIFDPLDSRYPEVLALRDDFPITPHQNLRPFLRPRALCLYEVPYEEIRLNWTAATFIERVRDWLRKAALDQLHAADQELEPLFFSANAIALISRNTVSDLLANETVPVCTGRLGTETQPIFLIGKREVQTAAKQAHHPIVTLMRTGPLQHGIINAEPQNLWELARVCKEAQLDLLDVLGKRIRGWAINKELHVSLDSRLMLGLIFPKTRQAGGPVEKNELCLVLTTSTVREIGVALDVLETKNAGGFAAPILDIPGSHRKTEESQVAKIGTALVRPVFLLDQDEAAKMSGQAVDKRRLVAVGAGTLGSQIITNLARTGFGCWTLIDHDHLMPHNCARHSLDGSAIGFPKAEAVADRIRWTLDDINAATPIEANVLKPGGKAGLLEQSYRSADAILDCSASTAVSRYLAGLDVKARRVAVFLNPSGADFVLFAEDAERQQTLDWLEAQYFQHVCCNPKLAAHLSKPAGNIRYGRGCSDVTTQLNQEIISAHAGLGARAVRKALTCEAAQILMLRADAEALSVERVDLPTIPPLIEDKLGGWCILLHPTALAKAHALARTRLPNETGGVLVGSFDAARKRAYVLDVIPSPPDSKEWPHLYIRGVIGLRAQIQELAEKSAGNITYVGEWHSHPGADAVASKTDKAALNQITMEMAAAGLPGVMLIVARQANHQTYLASEDF